METKKEIRQRIRACRSSLSITERQKYSSQIQNALFAHPLYQNASEIYCYVSFGDEVETGPIMDNSWKMGKKVAVPRIAVDNSSKALSMQFYYIDSPDELEPGYYGILEPVTRRKAEGSHVLVVMPGVAFDADCNRIGYGKGFYDSYLRDRPDYRRIALAYSIQCIRHIPADAHDIRPEVILTEKERYSC